MKNIIDVGINAPFDLGRFNDNIDDKTYKILKKITSNTTLFSSDLRRDDKYDVVVLDSQLEKTKFKTTDETEIVYDIKTIDGRFKVSTGKYIGTLVVDGVTIRINSGYSKFFTKRLLDFSNSLFFDNSARFTNDNNSDDELAIMLQYLFLTSLRKANVVGLPKEYKTIQEVGFNVKGSINTSKYISGLNSAYRGIPFSYKSREYNTDILKTVCKAFSLCNKNYVSNSFKDLQKLVGELKDYLDNYFVHQETINKAKRSPILNNEIYSPFKRVIAYAEMLILHKGCLPIDGKDNKTARGWLIDVADLWELYLYQLIRVNFPDWDVLYQEEIPIYKHLFFHRSFVPDIVMKKGNNVVIIDAKFKKMDFNENGNDVDRSDLQQIHTYYAYYLSNGFNVKFTTLIYPSRNDPDDNTSLIGNVFESPLDSRFGISYIVIGESLESQKINERSFIQRLHREIER